MSSTARLRCLIGADDGADVRRRDSERLSDVRLCCSRSNGVPNQIVAVDGELVVASVVRLLACGRPAAIARLVSAVVVASVDRHAGRPLAHVGQEVFKRLPSFTHCDPATAVQEVIHLRRTRTTHAHRAPGSPCRRVAHAVRFPAVSTAARLRLAVRKYAGGHEMIVPAVAAAQPDNVTVPPSVRLAHRNQEPASFTGKLQRHAAIIALLALLASCSRRPAAACPATIQVQAARPPATIVVTPEPAPCVLPAWPRPPALGGIPHGDHLDTYPDGLAEIARFVAGVTAYYDANERCRQ